MLSVPDYDEHGFLIVSPEDDRCARYVPNEGLLNLNRCVCCVSFDAPARRCRNCANRVHPPRGKEARDGAQWR